MKLTGKKVLTILIIFTIVYTSVIMISDFGIPNTIDFMEHYPCKSGFNLTKGGYLFENCYFLKLNPFKENG